MPINIPRARYKRAGSYLCRPIISMYRENRRDYSRTLEKLRYLATIAFVFVQTTLLVIYELVNQIHIKLII